MATEKAASFEELAKLATDFVTARKGFWDHAAWTDFLSNVQTKGFDISEEMQSSLGELLEAIKRFYGAAGSTESIEKAMSAVINDSVAFVERHNGVWGHPEWEDFVKTVRQNTHSLSEGATEYLGGMLESMKVFYQLSPVGVVQKRVSAARAGSSAATAPALETEKKAETKSAAAKAPAETKSAAAKAPAETKSAVAKAPAETKPAAAKAPAETKPAAAKAPAETKPAAAKAPAETKPAAAKAPAETNVVPKPSPKVSDTPDDLTAIDGIGPTLAKKLNAAGILSYAQLAALTDDDIENLEKNVIRFSGRVRRDDWVGQAKKLSQNQ
jgi:predicted flap endonuclease-1-like 5' DNA nuclease